MTTTDRTSTSVRCVARRAPLLIALPALLLLTACGPMGSIDIGTEVRISDGSMTVTSIEAGTADDVSDLELDDLEGQVPYFVHYDVAFNEGADDIDEHLWKAKTTGGEATAIDVFSIGGGFDCAGLGEVVERRAEGCQLFMVPEDADLESVSYGGAGTWKAPADS